MNDHELDAEFERIIAGWDETATDPSPADGQAAQADSVTDAAEDASPDQGGGSGLPPGGGPDTSAGDASGTAGPDPAATGPAAPALPKQGDALNLPISPTTRHVWRGGAPADDDPDAVLEQAGLGDDDHFVPPEVELPSTEDDPMYWAILACLAGGPLLLLYVLVLDRGGSGWWIVTALTMTVVGFVMLVLRGGTERDPFDDGTRV
jgi:hypothetical protein